MKNIKLFEEFNSGDTINDNVSSSKKLYYEVVEQNDHEGETWSAFIPQEGNEPFIEKLKSAIKKFNDEISEYSDDGNITVSEKLVPEDEVDMLVRRAQRKNDGYYPQYNKYDIIVNPTLVKVGSFEEFMNSFYKLKYFEG